MEFGSTTLQASNAMGSAACIYSAIPEQYGMRKGACQHAPPRRSSPRRFLGCAGLSLLLLLALATSVIMLGFRGGQYGIGYHQVTATTLQRASFAKDALIARHEEEAAVGQAGADWTPLVGSWLFGDERAKCFIRQGPGDQLYFNVPLPKDQVAAGVLERGRHWWTAHLAADNGEHVGTIRLVLVGKTTMTTNFKYPGESDWGAETVAHKEEMREEGEKEVSGSMGKEDGEQKMPQPLSRSTTSTSVLPSAPKVVAVPVPRWKVITVHGLNVREHPKTTAVVLGTKWQGAVVRGWKEGQWVRLANESGFMLISDHVRHFMKRVDIKAEEEHELDHHQMKQQQQQQEQGDGGTRGKMGNSSKVKRKNTENNNTTLSSSLPLSPTTTSRGSQTTPELVYSTNTSSSRAETEDGSATAATEAVVHISTTTAMAAATTVAARRSRPRRPHVAGAPPAAADDAAATGKVSSHSGHISSSTSVSTSSAVLSTSTATSSRESPATKSIVGQGTNDTSSSTTVTFVSDHKEEEKEEVTARSAAERAREAFSGVDAAAKADLASHSDPRLQSSGSRATSTTQGMIPHAAVTAGSAGGASTVWVVVAPHGLNVRQGQSSAAIVLNSKLSGARVRGVLTGTGLWLRLSDEPGFMLVKSSGGGELLRREKAEG